MTLKEAIYNRHAVRSYMDKVIEESTMKALNKEIIKCNTEGNLNIQLITNEKNAFRGILPFYGKFREVSNYFALVGTNDENLEEKAGYYGEQLVLRAQQLGLNTCWVAATYNKKKCSAKILKDEKLVCIIALGYGKDQGVAHKSKPMEELCKLDRKMPDWFKAGMETVMLAPTALNKQDFCILLDGEEVKAKIIGKSYSKINYGIIKYHFEVGCGNKKSISLL